MVILGAISGLVVGFMAGLFTFKAKLKWCPSCGNTLTCAQCRTGIYHPRVGTLA